MRGATRLAFTLPAAARVTLAIHDVQGRRVATLLDGVALAAGAHALEWRAVALPPGVYAVRLATPGGTTTRRAVIVGP